MKVIVPIVCALALTGCAALKPQVEATAPVVAPETQPRPQARPAVLSTAPRPPAGARTEEQFDTTSRAERAAAAAPAPAAEAALGETVVSLGDVTQPGFWLETSLVSAPAKGRVVYGATGKSAQVDLRPIETGSRLSLAAMRLIEAPLTDLPTVAVFRVP